MTDSLPTGDLVIFGFCELMAIGFACEFAAKLLSGKFLLASVAFVITLVLFVTGLNWPAIKTKIKAPLVAKIEGLAGHPRVQITLLLLFVGYLLLQGVLYGIKLRADLDTYVMPRIVTSSQERIIKRVLSKHEPHAVTIKADGTDQEAMGFATQIRNAITKAGWPVPPIDQIAGLGQGIQLQVGNHSPPAIPNTHPENDPARVLTEALNDADVMYGGQYSDGGQYDLFLLVGHRPPAIGPGFDRPPLLYKFGQWIQGLGQ
jgi:hypothetical protein